MKYKMMKDRRGILPILIFIAAIIVFAVIALGLGFMFFDKIQNALGSKYILYGSIVLLLIVFNKPVTAVLLTVIQVVRNVLKV